MDCKIVVAAHKKYWMPREEHYLPVHVGKALSPHDFGYTGDDTGDNISNKNPYYCELTALYWAWKNLRCDYLGLAHYRRHFAARRIPFQNGRDAVLTGETLERLIARYPALLPKKRRYYIETIYSHYAHTFYGEHLDLARELIATRCPEYLPEVDAVYNRRWGYMFNMFIMRKDLADEYCAWLFPLLTALEELLDLTGYTAFHARLFGRVSELLFNVWLLKKQREGLPLKEIPYVYLEQVNWPKKIGSFLRAKFLNERYEQSF